MAVFNVSFLNPSLRKASGGTGVGILADQLTILQNELGKDGYLSPGDYDILIKKAREIQTTANLTADQKSNYDVKISSYESAKAVSQFQKNEDLESMGNEMKNANIELAMAKGNNPAKYLDTKAAMLKSRLDDLAQIIDRKSTAGDDVTEHQMEYYNVLGEYQNILDAAKGADSYMNWFAEEESKRSADKNYKPSSNQPIIDGYAAYVSTNRKGEIIDIDYAPIGDKDGYMETNGIIGGFRIMAKPIKKGGYYTFKLGNDNYMVPEYDPNNPLAKPSKLIAGTSLNTLGQPESKNTSDIFYNPESIRMQIGIPNGGYAKGLSSGVYYKKNGPSDYTKYINFKPEEMGIDESEILPIPKTIEDSIIPFSNETIDAAEQIKPDAGMSVATPFGQNQNMSPNPFTANPYNQSQAPNFRSSQPNTSIDQSRVGATKTPQQPIQNKPATFGSTIQRTIQSGVDFFKKLF